jgi:alkanesulfonate monooxygenase SsuD/methylene tetrahydromethanopterin reductase-like flavin-dependent oxidoreductase (luciferase family)
LRKLGFLTIGLFEEDDPADGHEATLRVIELGERLGFDSAWARHQHRKYGTSSPVAVLAAASQRKFPPWPRTSLRPGSRG